MKPFIHMVVCLIILNPEMNGQFATGDGLRHRPFKTPYEHDKLQEDLVHAKILAKSDLPAAQEALSRVSQIARRTQDPFTEIECYILSSYWHRKQYNYLMMHQAGQAALQLAEKINNDSIIIASLVNLSDGYAAEGKHQESKTYIERALKLQELHQNDPVPLANLLCKLGRILRNTGEFELAFSLCERALKLCQVAQNPSGEAFALSTLSLIYAKKGDNLKALSLEEDALKLAQISGDQYREVVSLHNICDWNLRMGNLTKALELTKIIEPLNHVLDDPNADIELYKMKGRIFYFMKDLEQAMVHFQKALNVSKQVKNPYYQLGVWEDMTPVLISLKKTNQAENDLLMLEQDLLNNRDSIHLPKVWLALGRLEMANENVKYAIPHFLKSSQWYLSKQMIIESADALLELSKIYLENNLIDEAMNRATQSLLLFKQSNSKSSIAKVYLTLKEIYYKKSEYQKALTYFEQYNLLKDSLVTEELQHRLAEERVRQNIKEFESEKNITLQKNNLLARQNKLYITLGISLLTLLFAGTYLYQKLRNIKNILNDKHLELLKLSQTKDKFFGIIAHDLRGPLASFQGIGDQLGDYFKKGDTQKIENILSLLTKSAFNLRSLLDNLLSWALMNRGEIPYVPSKVNLHALVDENIQLYMPTAESKGIQMINQVSGKALVWADSNASDTIIRNLLGNAVKFAPSKANAIIKISSEMIGENTHLTIFNSGEGLPLEKLSQLFNYRKQTERGTSGEKGTGLGLILCKELAEINQGSIELRSDENIGVYATVILPNIKYNNPVI